MHRRAILAAVAACALGGGLIHAGARAAMPAAAPAPPPPLGPAEQALVDRAAAYLDGLGQVEGHFVQTDARGGVSRGRLYLSRPGKARFEYEGPGGRIVVSNGHTLLVYDPRLKSFDRYPLASTPLALFLQRHVRLDQKVVVTDVERAPGGFSISIRDGRRVAQGRATLTFGDAPMALREWSILDVQGGRTTVRLSDLHAVSGLDPKLFELDDPTQPRRIM